MAYVPDEESPPRGMPAVDADPFKRVMETTIYANMNDTLMKHYTKQPNDLQTVAEIMERIRPLLEIIKPILVANKSPLLQQRIAQGSNVNDYSPEWFANAISNVFPDNSEMFSKMLMVLQPLEFDYTTGTIKINDLFSQTWNEVVPLLQEKLTEILSRDRTMSEPRQVDIMVQMDEPSSLCLYFRDPTISGILYVPTIPNTRYNLSKLYCLTPIGLVNTLKPVDDYDITGDQLTLNQRNIKAISFHLTRESRDDPMITLKFPNDGPINLPFNHHGVTKSLNLYVPPNQNGEIPVSYHSKYVDVQLSSIAGAGLNDVTVLSIDPNEMIATFASDMRNVHLHANLQLRQCPMEQLVSARVNFAGLTEPICAFLDNLFTSTDSLDNTNLRKIHIKIPYIYSINMQAMTCTRTLMKKHDLVIPLATPGEFASFKTPDGLTLEQHLIQYTLFQMMLNYRKFTWDEFRTCPVHDMTFDLYLRRDQSQVGYHYDLTPGTLVSSVGLLYSMPKDHMKMGPQIIPRRYRTDITDADDARIDKNVMPMSAFVMRNSAILFNNATSAHTTPNVPNFLSREAYTAPYEVKNSQHATILSATLNVTHDDIEIPPSIRAKLMQSSDPSRTFLRSWHIVDISPEQKANLGIPESVAFSMPFGEMAIQTMEKCFAWVSEAGCTCIEVGIDRASGEVRFPSKIPGHLRGGRTPSQFGFPKTSKAKAAQLKAVSTQSKTQHSQRSKMASHIRAYTISISHMKQQIGSKLEKIRAVLNNPKKNLLVLSGPTTQRRAHSYSHTQYAPRKRSQTRKVRSTV
jgi:hypothetical protein